MQKNGEIESFEDTTVSGYSNRHTDPSFNEMPGVPDLDQQEGSGDNAMDGNDDPSAPSEPASQLAQKPQQPHDVDDSTLSNPSHNTRIKLGDYGSTIAQIDDLPGKQTESKCINLLEEAQSAMTNEGLEQRSAEKTDTAIDETQDNAFDSTTRSSTLRGDQSSTPNGAAADVSHAIAVSPQRASEMLEPPTALQGESADMDPAFPQNDKHGANEEFFDQFDYNTDEEHEDSNEDNQIRTDIRCGKDEIAAFDIHDPAHRENGNQQFDSFNETDLHSFPNTQGDQKDRFELHPRSTSEVEDTDHYEGRYTESDGKHEQIMGQHQEPYPEEVHKPKSSAYYGYDESLLGHDIGEPDIEQQSRSAIALEATGIPTPHEQQTSTVTRSQKVTQLECSPGHDCQSAAATRLGSHKRTRNSEEESENLGAELQGTSISGAHVTVFRFQQAS